MKILSRILVAVLVVALVLALVAGGGFLFVTRQSFPQVTGRMTMGNNNTSLIQLPGLTGEVEIIRDTFGVPHIYADAPEDLFRAQGFVHAQDRFFQMEFSRRIGQSGHAYNAHYDDMIAKWLNGQQNPMLWSRADVQKNAEATLVLTP